MTAQVPDRFEFEGHQYALVGGEEEQLFDPEQFGLQPEGRCTACWRGYQCWYTVKDDRLLLSRLEVTLGDYIEAGMFISKMGPEFNGVRPIRPKGFSFHNNLYDQPDIEIKHTGGILIADHLIESLYGPTGFYPAWSYETVLKLVFEEGKLLEARDVSGKVKKIRGLMCGTPVEPGPGDSPKLVTEWNGPAFSLEYEL